MKRLTHVEANCFSAPAVFTPVSVCGPLEESAVGFKAFEEDGHRFLALLVYTPEGVATARLDAEQINSFGNLFLMSMVEMAESAGLTPVTNAATVQ